MKRPEDRAGCCICGTLVRHHFDADNQKISCEAAAVKALGELDEFQRSLDDSCEHGIAFDCHCCDCGRSGFLFDPSACVCLAPGDPKADPPVMRLVKPLRRR